MAEVWTLVPVSIAHTIHLLGVLVNCYLHHLASNCELGQSKSVQSCCVYRHGNELLFTDDHNEASI